MLTYLHFQTHRVHYDNRPVCHKVMYDHCHLSLQTNTSETVPCTRYKPSQSFLHTTRLTLLVWCPITHILHTPLSSLGTAMTTKTHPVSTSPVSEPWSICLGKKQGLLNFHQSCTQHQTIFPPVSLTCHPIYSRYISHCSSLSPDKPNTLCLPNTLRVFW